MFIVAVAVMFVPMRAMEELQPFSGGSSNNGAVAQLAVSRSRFSGGMSTERTAASLGQSDINLVLQPYSGDINNDNNINNGYGNSALHSSIMRPRVGVGNFSGFKDPKRALIAKNFMNEITSLGENANKLVGINYKDKDGNTSLHVVVAYVADNFSSLAFCEELIADGADVTQLNNHGESALALAIEFGDENVARYLQSQTDKALKLAAQVGSLEWVTRSIAAGADVSSGDMALRLAAFRGHQDICNVLSAHGARLESSDQEIPSSLSIRQLNNQVSATQLLELHGSNQLISAVKRGDMHSVERCIDLRVDLNSPNMFGALALHEAVAQKDVDMCQFLLAHGADTTAQDAKRKTPLDLVDESTPEELKRLLQGHLDDLLLNTVIDGDAHKVGSLIAARANVNAVDSLNNSALLLAANYQHPKVAHALIKQDADLNLENNWGNTPLIVAAFVGSEHIAEMLLKKRAGKNPADINHQNNAKRTALMMASVKGFERLVKLFLKHGANTELHDRSNETALTGAQSNGYESIVQLLSKGHTATEDWINANTKRCPRCECRWMKDSACDKMTCGRIEKGLPLYGGCGAEWCWQCGSDWGIKCNHHMYTQPVVSAAQEQLTYKNLVKTVFGVSLAAGIGYIGSKVLALTWVGLKLVNNNTFKWGLKNTNLRVIHAPLTRPTGNTQPIGTTPVVTTPVAATPVAATPVAATPVAATPVAATPVAATPVAATPVAATPVAATPVAATPVAATPVAATPVATTPVAATPVATKPVEGPIYGPVEPPVPHEPSEPRNSTSLQGVGYIPTNSFSFMPRSKLVKMDGYKFSKWEICPEFANAAGCLFSHVHENISANGTCYAIVEKNFNITWNDYLVKMAQAQTVLPNLEIPEWVIEYISTTDTNLDWFDYARRMAHLGQPIPRWAIEIIKQ